MSQFQVHTKQTAPAASAELLGNAEKAYGFIPNLLGSMAESPATLKAYMALGQIFNETSFTSTERHVLTLAASRFNECRYCMGAHSAAAGMQKVPADVINAIRNDQPIADSRLEALRKYVTAAVEQRGWLSDEDNNAFLAAGYTGEQMLEVVLAIAYKTMSNYVNHIVDAPLDEAFAPAAWAPAENRLAS